VTPIAIVVVQFPSCRLLRIQSKLGIALAPLNVACGQRDNDNYQD